ncbi:MAG: TolC family protein [Pseudomonadota bacterium]|nr:TolC family protein [Pseudomonadota bacterium]
MENVKINRICNILSYFTFTCVCIYTIASPKIISLDDAVRRYMSHNTEMQQLQEHILLLEQKTSLNQHRYYPKISPVTASFDPLSNTGTIGSGLDWQLPTGGQIKLNVNKTDEKDTQYNLQIEQPLSQTKPAQDAQTTLQLDIDYLQHHERLEKLVLSFRQFYRQCVQSTLELKQQQRLLSALHTATKKQKLLFQYGEISKIEFEKSISLLERRSIDMLKLERQFELDMIQLKQQLGIDIQQEIVLDDQIHFHEAELTPAHIMSAAYAHNRPYQISQLKQKISALQYKAAESEQQPKMNLIGSINQDSEASLGVSLTFSLPSAATNYVHAQNTLNYLQSQQSAYQSTNDLKTKIHSDLINLIHQKSLIALSAKNLQQEQTIFQAETLKFEHNDISTEALEDASEKLESAFLESTSAQVQYANYYEALMQSIGQFHTLSTNEPTDE